MGLSRTASLPDGMLVKNEIVPKDRSDEEVIETQIHLDCKKMRESQSSYQSKNLGVTE